jgi:hypothetical protein
MEPAWEQRGASQDEWWEMLDARLLSDAPVRSEPAFR